MRLKLPHSLHYPITVTELLKQPNDDVERFAPLFDYTYQTVVTETERSGEQYQVKKTFPSRFESSVEGTLKSWMLSKGTVILGPGHEIAEIEEPCAHGVQYGGMCVTCGKDMTEYSYVTTQLDASRANINMIHDNVALTVSQDEATKVETEAKRRLVAAKKLSLVVDLDQTIIHATVDPTVAEWQKDPANPNYEAIKDVKAFQLIDEGPGGRGTWYYIKLRPGLKVFLENVSKIYELHIYTMGTRAYAQNIANLVDPDRKIFGDRILSRDESGSMVAKNLQRLFPVDTKMVVIIDDRADVWNWNPNLIKVTAFSFFIGIGDINSSFLPKRATTRAIVDAKPDAAPEAHVTPESSSKDLEIVPGGTATKDKSSVSNQGQNSTDGAVSALEQLVTMGGGDDPNVLQAQNAQQDEILAAQLQERPLLQKQKQLDEEDNAEMDPEKARHHLLSDDDNELYWLEQALRKVHTEFFDSHARRVADLSGGRLAELRGSQTASKRKTPTADSDLDLIPDIKAVMPVVKSRILSGVSIVFSGVIPLHTDLDTVEMVILAKSFGARVQANLSGRSTTHVVAARNRTAKVRQAVKRGKGKIKIVNLAWLMDCIVQWRRVNETPYLLKTEDVDIGKPFPDEPDDIISGCSASESPASNMDTDTEATDPENLDSLKNAQRLRISTAHDEDEDIEGLLPEVPDDEHSPVGGSGADWSDMHNEMEEFLGSDADDSDNDSVSPLKRNVDNNGKAKRSHAEVTASDSEESTTSNGRRSSPERKKLATGRSTALNQSQKHAETALPKPTVTAEREDSRAENGVGGEVDGNDDATSDHGWSDFDEDDLEAELERAEDDGAENGDNKEATAGSKLSGENGEV